MNIILLSGGSGKRLWPLSNDVRSKQFIKIFKSDTGKYESMVQRIYRQLKEVDSEVNLTIATSRSQVSAIHNQLGDQVNICVEPCRRDTFPAIALAVSYLYDIKKVGKDEIIIVCPVDPYVGVEYFRTLQILKDRAIVSDKELILMGIEPTYASEKYGYIIPSAKDRISTVKEFKEKPKKSDAEYYIKCGALWNGGVFAFRLGYLLSKAHELIEFDDYDDLFNKYSVLPKISFDYAVVENEKKIEVVRFTGEWKDLGTWNTLTEAMEEKSLGNVIFDDSCEDVNVINELDVPVLCMGLKQMVVAIGPDGILVSDKEKSSYIKPYVDSIDQQVMFAEKSWGSYRVLDIGQNSMTIKVTLNPGEKMYYHSHERRNEIWNIMSGEGVVIVDGMEHLVGPGDVVTMQAGCRHTIIAKTGMEVVEVQLGDEITVRDKKKYELDV